MQQLQQEQSMQVGGGYAILAWLGMGNGNESLGFAVLGHAFERPDVDPLG